MATRWQLSVKRDGGWCMVVVGSHMLCNVLANRLYDAGNAVRVDEVRYHVGSGYLRV